MSLVYDKYFLDTQREIDANGYLRVTASNITKSQIRPYLGREIPNWQGFNLDANKIYNVLCPAEELQKAANTFNNLPLTRDHIEVDVNDVPKEKIVGSLGDHASFEAPYLKNSLIVYDKKDIDLILSGKKRELSCGYRYTPVRESGEFEGQHYDFKMTDIIGNHVALVRQGRAGRDVMVADSSKSILDTIKEKILAVFDHDLVGDIDEKKEENVEWVDVNGSKVPMKKEMVGDEFKESEHPRAKNGRFTSAGGSGSTVSIEHKGAKIEIKKDGKYADVRIYAPEGKKFKNGDTFYTTEAEADKAEELAKKIIDNEFGGSEKKEESSKETAVEKMYKKLSEQGMKGEALEQAIYEKHGWEGVEEAKMISEYESGNPKHSQKEQEELVKSLEEKLGDYKRIVKNFEDQGETGIDYNHYKQMVERQEDALEKAKSQLDWIKRHTKEKTDDLTEDKASDKIEEKELPVEAGKPEAAGEEKATKEGETEMTEEVKEVEKEEEKKPETPAKVEKDEKPAEVEKKEEKSDSKEESAEKADEKKEAEGEKIVEDKPEEAKKEDKKEEKKEEEKPTEDKCGAKMAKDEAMVMDADAIRAEAKAEAMEDYKARDCARKSVRHIVGDVDVFAFDSAEEIYKFACEKAGMDLDGIANYKDAFKGLSAGKSKLVLDASSINGSNEECFKGIRVD